MQNPAPRRTRKRSARYVQWLASFRFPQNAALKRWAITNEIFTLVIFLLLLDLPFAIGEEPNWKIVEFGLFRLKKTGSTFGPNPAGIGCWFGTNFELWKSKGHTPLWLVFPSSQFGQASQAASALELLDPSRLSLRFWINDEFNIGLQIPPGVEKETAIRSILEDLALVRNYILNLKNGKPLDARDPHQ